MNYQDDSTIAEKALVCGTSFGFACLAFLASALILVPLTGAIATAFNLPDIFPQAFIMIELFGLPVFAALWGISVAAKPIIALRTLPETEA